MLRKLLTKVLLVIGAIVLLSIVVRAPHRLAGSPLSPQLVHGATVGPPLTLWAWERPEDLRFLRATGIAVAPLVATITLADDDLRVAPRRQPLALPEDMAVTAVVRVELEALRPATFSRRQAMRLAEAMVSAASAGKFTTLQVDFDAPRSARPFYRRVLDNLRAELPRDVRLSMTALASWCLGDPWLNDLPIDEVVPMAFRMGADTDTVRRHLASGQDFQLACRFAMGIATDEPLPRTPSPHRRLYVFPVASWTPDEVRAVARTVGVDVP